MNYHVKLAANLVFLVLWTLGVLAVGFQAGGRMERDGTVQATDEATADNTVYNGWTECPDDITIADQITEPNTRTKLHDRLDWLTIKKPNHLP